MSRLFGSVIFRLALGYGALVVGAMMIISAVFYFGTVGVIGRAIDAKLAGISSRLTGQFDERGTEALRQEIQRLLTDDIDQHTEVYLLLDPEGQAIVGNLSSMGSRTPLDRLTDAAVTRYGRPSESRLLPHRLSNGALLVVGCDLSDLHAIEQLVLRALVIGGAVALCLAIGGALLFRRLLERRVAGIRRTAYEIGSGDLSRRIPIDNATDEFTLLNRDVNRMLDRIQQLMEGVRDVSNAIAHDLRTPLGRIRSLLDAVLRPGASADQLRDTAHASIEGIDDLILVFDKLLQIAEAESGSRRQCFRPVALGDVITNVVELFDATAEAKGVTLITDLDGEATTLGDKDLLANAAANLLDNALKYAGDSATLRVCTQGDRDTVSILVEDDGPGIAPGEREKVVKRFYRLDRSRSLPGNGLGLPTTAQGGFRSDEIALAAVRNRLRILGKSDVEIDAIENAPDRLRMNPEAILNAPIDGIVTQRQVGLGQYINSEANGASTPVFVIGDLSKVWLLANVREEDAPSMRVGEAVEVHVLAFPSRVFRATLTYVAAAIDPNTHRLPVRAEVENSDGALKPEMFADFSIITGPAAEEPAVPEEAVVYEGDTARVWVAGDNDMLGLREIRPGRTQDGMVEALSGLRAGEAVVTSGSLFIDRAAGTQ